MKKRENHFIVDFVPMPPHVQDRFLQIIKKMYLDELQKKIDKIAELEKLP